MFLTSWIKEKNSQWHIEKNFLMANLENYNNKILLQFLKGMTSHAWNFFQWNLPMWSLKDERQGKNHTKMLTNSFTMKQQRHKVINSLSLYHSKILQVLAFASCYFFSAVNHTGRQCTDNDIKSRQLQSSSMIPHFFYFMK